MTVEMPLFTETERRALRVAGEQSAKDCPRDKCVHQLFEEQVERTPQAIALVCGERRLTFTELNARANKLAHVLRARGVGPEKLVALCIDRSPEMVVGILGILKAGGAYVPLDPEYPPARLALMLEDAAAAVVITTGSLRRHLPDSAPVLLLDEPTTQTAFDHAPERNPTSTDRARALDPGRPAYVIYTSGSTGVPKGVVVTHWNVVRLFGSTRQWFDFGPNDVWTLFHSFAFDFSVWELWGALLYGGRLVIVPWTVSRSPTEFLELLVREQVTVLNQTPSAFYQLLQADREHLETGRKLSLRFIIFGGEALDFARVRDWYVRHPDESTALVNMYGITETTVHVTYQALSRELVRSAKSSLIGEPIPDLRVYVLDPNRAPSPIGVPGEMYVGGEGVARGYLNRSELTAEKFIADPFSSRPADRLYRTGDLACRRSDGNLEYLGRIDQQVKLRGFRIELGEIEAALTEHPQIADCAVQLREDRPGDKRLVAYLVPPKSETAPAAAEIRRSLQDKLPAHMVPSAYIVLEALPHTVSGKLDRQRLPAPDASRDDSAGDYAAPESPLEGQLASIFAGVLALERVGIHDSFFAFGGDSLLAAKLIAQIHQRLRVELAMNSVLMTPTPAGVAQLLVCLRSTGDVADRESERSRSSGNGGTGRALPRAVNRSLSGHPLASQILQPDGDPGDFLELLRDEGDGHPLVCVGHAQPIPLLLERVPTLGPVIHLKLDGSQIWPPIHLSFEEQLDAYVQQLEAHARGRRSLLIGYSYGGILAYGLASKLVRKGLDVDVMLIEPAVPFRYLPLKVRVRRRLGQIYRRARSGRSLAEDGPAEPISPQATVGESRWHLMHPHYQKNVDAASLRPLGQQVALVGGEPYHARYLSSWRKIETGGIESCVLPQTESHLSCFQEPGLSCWLDFFERWYRSKNPPQHS
ncbi:MAG TPA: amino acid adenylation domain-containing protein [Planctomycetaceae bacterium]|nr:amino acid adenylation domain-containing protein [Planctomycetaceae bacterium]